MSMVASVAGTLQGGKLTRARPFRAPHHSASMAALTGASVGREGEVDLVVGGTRRLRAKLDDDCPTLDFYRGFYLKPTADGQLCARRDGIPADDDLVFVEVVVRDPSDFEAELRVRGEVLHDRYRVLTLEHSSIPNALAALLLHVRDTTGRQPHVYFEWTEGNPFAQLLRFFLFGQGEVAPVTREVLREAEPDRGRRPRVHVG